MKCKFTNFRVSLKRKLDSPIWIFMVKKEHFWRRGRLNFEISFHFFCIFPPKNWEDKRRGKNRQTWISLPTNVSTIETKIWPSLAVICLARLQLTGAGGCSGQQGSFAIMDSIVDVAVLSARALIGWWWSCVLNVTSWTSWAQVCLNEWIRSSLPAGSVCKAACSASRMNWMTCARKSGISDASLDSSYSSINL